MVGFFYHLRNYQHLSTWVYPYKTQMRPKMKHGCHMALYDPHFPAQTEFKSIYAVLKMIKFHPTTFFPTFNIAKLSLLYLYFRRKNVLAFFSCTCSDLYNQYSPCYIQIVESAIFPYFIYIIINFPEYLLSSTFT